MSFVFHSTVGPKQAKYFGIDNNPQAIRSTEINSLLQEIPMKTSLFDMRYFQRGTLEPSFGKGDNNDGKFDVIISNPPWLVAKPLDVFIDSGNYDANEEFLTKLIWFVSHRLDRQKGVCFLIYSDLSQLLGTQAEKRVETLVKEHGMSVLGVYRFEGVVNVPKVLSHFDALKQRAGLAIYEIGF